MPVYHDMEDTKMQKKRILAVILALTMAVSLTLAGCGGKQSEYEERIAELEQENQELRSQVDALSAQLQAGSGLYLSDWSLTGSAWEGSGGADVVFTAHPSAYREGCTAALIIYLNGEEVNNTGCFWSEGTFTARVSLPAADGYSFYCLLADDQGNTSEVLLASPESPTVDELVYLETSMTAYCSVYLQSWDADSSKLTVSSGYATVQLPRLLEDGLNIGFLGARLCLTLNGEETDSKNLEMPQGEAEGCYETVLENISFDLPEIGPDDQLDLIIEATLSTGAVIRSTAGSWFLDDGALSLVVG